jgi:hypothetical protein
MCYNNNKGLTYVIKSSKLFSDVPLLVLFVRYREHIKAYSFISN